MDGNPPQSFWYVTLFRNDFTFSRKPLIFLTRRGIFNGWWRAAGGLWRHQRRSPSWPHLGFYPELKIRFKEQYLFTAHAPNFDFRTGCREIKKSREESKKTLKNPFASHLAEFSTTLKLLRITDQWYIVPVKFRFGRNRDFLALLLLPLAGGPKDGKRFDADWRFISSASFHTSSDNCERNTQKWNSNNRDCKKETIETWMWLRRSCGIKLHGAECFATTR